MDVTGGVLGGCCQVTVIASLSPLPTATTLEGHEGSLSSAHGENGDKDNTIFSYYQYILFAGSQSYMIRTVTTKVCEECQLGNIIMY